MSRKGQVLANKFHKTISFLNASSTAQISDVTLSLNTLIAPAALNTIQSFQFYKIIGVSIKAVPHLNNVASAGTSESTARPLYTLWEPNVDAAYTSVDRLVENSRTKIHKPYYGFNRYTRLRPTIDVTMGAETDVSMRSKNHWISTADVNALYGTFYIGLGPAAPAGTTVANIAYSLYVTTYVALKNINVPAYTAIVSKMELYYEYL